MGIMKKVAVLGIAKKVYDEARKPHNQKRIQDAVARYQSRRTKRPGR